MPALETPPNPPPTLEPTKVRAGRFGELDHTELVHLLDSLDDDRSRSRFRESVYLSLFFYIAVAWFVFYGPRVLFHQGRLINPADVLKQRDKEMTYLEIPKDLKVPPPKDAKAISEHNARQSAVHPTLDKKTLEELQKMRRAGPPAPVAAPTPKPLPDAPAPAATQPAPPQPAPPRPQPQPTVATNLPSAPTPPPATRPNFSTPSSAGQAIKDAADAVARNRGGGGGEGGANAPSRHAGLQAGYDILSDTQGVNFEPYIKRWLRMNYATWYPLIPQEVFPPLNKEGTTVIRFTIQPNGTVSAMHLDGPSGDVAIDRAAWGGITSMGQMPPLPKEFHGDNLQLRIQFVITHDGRLVE